MITLLLLLDFYCSDHICACGFLRNTLSLSLSRIGNIFGHFVCPYTHLFSLLRESVFVLFVLCGGGGGVARGQLGHSLMTRPANADEALASYGFMCNLASWMVLLTGPLIEFPKSTSDMNKIQTDYARDPNCPLSSMCPRVRACVRSPCFLSRSMSLLVSVNMTNLSI